MRASWINCAVFLGVMGTASLGAASLEAAAFKLEALAEAPPAAVAPAIAEALAKEGWRVVDPKGKPLVDLWLRREVPPLSPPQVQQAGAKFQSLEGTVLAAARYHQKHYDFKNKAIPAGVYTLRHGIQPQDGDHLGVSDTRDFALLAPADADKSLAPIPTADAVKLSCKVSGTKHPSIVWIKEASGEAPAKLPALVYQEEREYHILDFKIAVQGDVAVPDKGEKKAPEKGAPEKSADKSAAEKAGKGLRLGLVVVGAAPEA